MAEVQKVDQVSSAPTNKVSAAGIGGSITVVLIWLLKTYTNVELPPEVAAAIATVISFASGYMVREKVMIPTTDTDEVAKVRG